LDCSKNRLWQTILGHTANELRAHTVPNSKQEHQEGKRFKRLRNSDAYLSDQYTRKQRSGDRSQANSFESEFAKVVAQGKRQKDGDLRVLFESRSKPTEYGHCLSSLL